MASENKTCLLWFRQDLRLEDNQALLHAAEEGYEILPVYILDDENAGEWKMGGASRWWLHQSLEALNKSLKNNLIIRAGKADKIIPALIKESGANAVFWNRCYEPWRIERDKKIVETLKKDDIEFKSFKDALLWEPWEVLKDDKTPYKVFTPYYKRGCMNAGAPSKPHAAPEKIKYAEFAKRGKISDLHLMPKIKWYKGFEEFWTPGEKGASEKLGRFLDEGLKGYKIKRNRPDMEFVSRLSPHLHFGEISIRQCWHDSEKAGIAHHAETDAANFRSELGWREFSYYLLYHFPQITREPLQKKFAKFPWKKNTKFVLAWQKGQTGVPIIDAGMRQLWQTGWMHNRVRMIVGSYLIKHLLQNWHAGEDWFWDCLVDADLASNSASWQWVAGCGADAAPYFRVFNPVLQGVKFDPKGDYVRRYVPELSRLDNDVIHKPWEASDKELKDAGIKLGKDYPHPLVDLKEGREQALAAFQKIRNAA